MEIPAKEEGTTAEGFSVNSTAKQIESCCMSVAHFSPILNLFSAYWVIIIKEYPPFKQPWSRDFATKFAKREPTCGIVYKLHILIVEFNHPQMWVVEHRLSFGVSR